MIKNYIKIAWRNLLRNKTFSFINIFGLSIGLGTCLLLTLYIIDELTYDIHHKDVDQIYRVSMESMGTPTATVSAPMAKGLEDQISEVKESTRILKFPNIDKFLLKDKENNNQFYESNGFYVDATFFEIFTYDFKYGEYKTALNTPNTVVLSEEVATKMFGDINPVNKVIGIEIPYANTKYTVKGVFKNNTNKSHVKPNLLLSMKNDDVGEWVDEQTNWATNNMFYTYVKLNSDASITSFEEKLPAFYDKNAGPYLLEGTERTLFTTPLKDIYLKSDVNMELSANGSMTSIYIFSAIAGFLLLIACINFMNLSTARSEKRSKEVGMRKVLGAKKKSLIFQFLGESMILALISLVFALIIVVVMLPLFNSFADKNLSLLQYPSFVFYISGLAIITGVLSGLYPAFYLSSFRPITVLKGKLTNSFSVTAIRKGLVVFQFTISATLILVAGVIWQQMNFINDQDLGFQKEQQLIIPLRRSSVAERYQTMKSEILRNPNIKSVTGGSAYPGLLTISDNMFYKKGQTVEDGIWTRYGWVNDDYVKTLGYELLYGRGFSENSQKDSLSIILNETAVKQIGFEPDKAIGKEIFFEWNKEKFNLEIIGVIKDFNFQSLHEPIMAYGLRRLTGGQTNYLVANIESSEIESTLGSIEQVWKTNNPDTPFEYFFLDQNFDLNYASEKRTSNVVLVFMLIAIFIACIGLFGLASFTTEQRYKEVGIRKVLGASVISITTMHLKEFLKLIIFAMIIASPLAYYMGNRWLQNFAYQIDIGWKLFALTTLIAICIVFATVGYQVVKAAVANPIKSLRTE